jgi:type I restriction enzyme, S subunit
MSELPVGWLECNLEDISKLITKGTTPTTLGFKFLQDGIRFIKIENIKNKAQ